MAFKPNTPRFTSRGYSVYWTIYDNGERVATVMTQKDAEDIAAKFNALHDDVVALRAKVQDAYLSSLADATEAQRRADDALEERRVTPGRHCPA